MAHELGKFEGLNLRSRLLLVVVSAVLCGTFAAIFRSTDLPSTGLPERKRIMVADPASNANFNDARVQHLSLKWDVDFVRARINGTAALTIEFLKPTDKVILDGRSLEIKKAQVKGKDVAFTVDNAGVVGEKISVDVGGHTAGDKIELVFEYSTGAGCTALQFMRAEQTADKKGPFLFSQCQPIHARSLLPCMDTPSVKQTYDSEATLLYIFAFFLARKNQSLCVKEFF
ncbi:unnamed protein product [Toxocara canis]|uniref:Peptidase_M1_N domain-containing protein n=1 Tax=Toxocara canis TaxID=6265 RepID=A0A183UKA9_TOXCA|nr:unnamed protein product [Toxocara canis]